MRATCSHVVHARRKGAWLVYLSSSKRDALSSCLTGRLFGGLVSGDWWQLYLAVSMLIIDQHWPEAEQALIRAGAAGSCPYHQQPGKHWLF